MEKFFVLQCGSQFTVIHGKLAEIKELAQEAAEIRGEFDTLAEACEIAVFLAIGE